MVSFTVQKLFSLMSAHLFIFALVAIAFGVRSKKNIAKSDVKELIVNIFFPEFYGFWS